MVICGSVKKITMVTSCIKTHVIRQKLKEYDMVPVAMETFRSWGPSGLKFLKDIGARIALATGEKKSSYYLFQAISMACQRGNIISVLGTTPDTKKLDEIYYL